MLAVAGVVLLAGAGHAQTPLKVLAPVDPPHAAALARPPVPTASPATWISPNDYPVAAIRNGEEGVVGYMLDIDEAGSVSDCQVTQPSGSQILDTVTCQVMRTRASFRPATGGDGAPVRGRFTSKIRWEIPRERTAPEEGLVTGAFVIEKDGHISDCRLIAYQSAATKALKGEAARNLREYIERTFCMAQVYYLPYRDESGAPVSKRVTMTQSVRTETLKD